MAVRLAGLIGTRYAAWMTILGGAALLPRVAMVLAVLWPFGALAGTFVTIPLGAYTANIQSKLIALGPLGRVAPANPDQAPFDIPIIGNNYDEVALNAGYTLWTAVNVDNVTDVFTLINAYAPSPGVVVGVITFNFGNGTSKSADLVGGVNVRDFYQGGYANTLFGPSAWNRFTYANAAGGARTGRTRTGLVGTYVVDEQHFPLDGMGAGTTLVSVVITSPYGNRIAGGGGQGSPIILGLTVETPTVVSSLPAGGYQAAAYRSAVRRQAGL